MMAPVRRRRVVAHQAHEIDRPVLRPERPVSAASDGLILDGAPVKVSNRVSDVASYTFARAPDSSRIAYLAYLEGIEAQALYTVLQGGGGGVWRGRGLL